MQSIWLTSLSITDKTVAQLAAGLKTYGLETEGNLWQDDLESLAWTSGLDVLVDKKPALWLILGTAEDFSKPAIRYGLSLLTLAVRAKRGATFPIVVLQGGADAIKSDELPTPLESLDILKASDPTLGAKLVAKIHSQAKLKDISYQIDMHGNPQVGQWFEVRPQHEKWPGIIFGVCDADISFQAVGAAGVLPEKSVLEHPVQGLKITYGKKEFTAWAVQNEIEPESAYYAQVSGFPDTILFGPYTERDGADMFMLRLK